MKSAHDRTEAIIQNESWWGGTINPPGNRRVLAQLITQAINEAVFEAAGKQVSSELVRFAEPAAEALQRAEAAGKSFRKVKA